MSSVIAFGDTEYTHIVIDGDGRVEGLARNLEEFAEVGRFASIFWFDSDQGEDFEYLDRRLYAHYEFLPVPAASRETRERAEYRIEQLVSFELV